MADSKTCTWCKVLKPLSDYDTYRNASGNTKTRSHCSDCRRADIMRRYHAKRALLPVEPKPEKVKPEPKPKLKLVPMELKPIDKIEPELITLPHELIIWPSLAGGEERQGQWYCGNTGCSICGVNP